MDGTTIDAHVAAALAAARADIVVARQARFRLLERIRDLRECHAGSALGYRTTRRLLETIWHLDAGDAGRLIRDADDLMPTATVTGEPLPAKLPATAAAMAEGLVGEHHVRVIRRTIEHLERVPGMDPGAVEAAEQTLAAVAPTLPPKSLEKAAHRLVTTLDPDGAAPVEDPDLGDEVLVGGRGQDSLTLTARLHGRAEIDMVTEVLDALSTPAGPDDTRSLAKRRAEALKDLFAQALQPAGIAADQNNADVQDVEDVQDAENVEGEPRIPAPRQPADDPAPTPSSHPGCPTVRIGGQAMLTITIDHRWLTQQIGHGVLDSDVPVHPGTVRRWACDACIVPMILGTDSQPLDVGRMTRTVPDGLRRALTQRDGGCSWPGCTRRPKRCHAHHLEHWADGGDTKLEKLPPCQ